MIQTLNLKQRLTDAKARGYAIGAFNIFNYISIKAVLEVADELKAPVMLQTSMSTVRKFGASELFRMVCLLRRHRAVILHLDHCTDLGMARECIDLGWDSVMIDLSAKSFDENVAGTLEIKRLAQSKGVSVEGELGVIRGVEDHISSDVESQPSFQKAMEFIGLTNVDAFAPAIGTAHGLYKEAVKINYGLVKELSNATDIPVVIHGGTGLSEEQFRRLIENGAAKINVSTALKQAYLKALQEYLKQNGTDADPLKLDMYAEAELRHTVKQHVRYFGAAGAAQ